MHGFCHIEIPTTDAKKSKEFYTKMFGWKTEEAMPSYMMFNAPDGPGGGFTTTIKPTKDGIILYIEVEDINKKFEEIEKTGGEKLVSKTKISDEHGFYGIFADPCGNSIGLWSKK